MKNFKLRKFLAYYFLALLFFATSTLSLKIGAQPSQQERALEDYAKQYDKAQQGKRIENLERAIEGTSGAGQSVVLLFYIFGTGIAIAISWVVFSNFILPRFGYRTKDDERRSKELKAFMANDILEHTPKEKVSELTLDQLKKITGKDKSDIRFALDELQWDCADYSGIQTGRRLDIADKLAKESGRPKEQILKNLLEEESYQRNFKELVSQEKARTPSEKGVHITLLSSNQDPDSSISWYLCCIDKKGKIIPKYGVLDFLGIPDEDAPGFDFGENISMETIHNPKIRGENVTISLYPGKYLKKVQFIAIFISTSTKYLEKSTQHSNLIAEILNVDDEKNPITHKWNFDTPEEKFIQIGYFEKSIEQSWKFVASKVRYLEISNLDLCKCDDTSEKIRLLEDKFQVN